MSADRPTPAWYDDDDGGTATTWSSAAPVPVTPPPAPLDLLAAAALEPIGAPVSPPLPPRYDPRGESSVDSPSTGPHPGRLAVGLAVLAAERLRVGAPTRNRLVVGVGLAQQAAARARTMARRVTGPPGRLAGRTLDWAARRAGGDLVARSRERVDEIVLHARLVGAATVEAGRSEADALLRASVTDGIGWAQSQAVPQIVDSLVPHLVESVVPRLIDGVMPEIRERVLPVIIEDLTNDPRLRDLVLEQSRDVVDETAQHVRSVTATADDRVEAAFRRLVGGGPTDASPTEG